MQKTSHISFLTWAFPLLRGMSAWRTLSMPLARTSLIRMASNNTSSDASSFNAYSKVFDTRKSTSKRVRAYNWKSELMDAVDHVTLLEMRRCFLITNFTAVARNNDIGGDVLQIVIRLLLLEGRKFSGNSGNRLTLEQFIEAMGPAYTTLAAKLGWGQSKDVLSDAAKRYCEASYFRICFCQGLSNSARWIVTIVGWMFLY